MDELHLDCLALIADVTCSHCSFCPVSQKWCRVAHHRNLIFALHTVDAAALPTAEDLQRLMAFHPRRASLDVRKTAKAKALAAFLGSLPEGLPLEYVSARGSFASESVSEQFGQLSRFTTLRRVTIEFMSELLADTSKLFRIFGGAGVEEAAIWGSGFSLLPRPALDEVTGSFAHLRVLVFKFGLADNELNTMLYRLGAARQLERLVLYMGFWRKSAVDPDAFRQLSTLPSLRWLELECGSAQDNRDIWVPPLGLLCECP